MYTQCPECNTAFRISTEQLRMGQGRVQCSKCQTLFDAISSLSDIAFEDHFSDLRKLPTLPLEQALPPPIEDEIAAGNGMTPLPAWNVIPSDTLKTSRTWWLSGVILSLLLLFFQLVFFEGGDFVQNPTMRPWIEEFCVYARCRLPGFRNPRSIEVLESSLQPIGPDTMEFRAVLVNGSRIRQVFPRIKLDLIKLNGEPLARRVFFPEEYLADSSSTQTQMAVRKPVQIRIEIRHPDGKIGGFHFSLI